MSVSAEAAHQLTVTWAGQNEASIDYFLHVLLMMLHQRGWTLKLVAALWLPTSKHHWLSSDLRFQRRDHPAASPQCWRTLWVTLTVGINFTNCSPLRRINALFPAVIKTFKDSFIHWCKQHKMKHFQLVDGEKQEALREKEANEEESSPFGTSSQKVVQEVRGYLSHSLIRHNQ